MLKIELKQMVTKRLRYLKKVNTSDSKIMKENKIPIYDSFKF